MSNKNSGDKPEETGTKLDQEKGKDDNDGQDEKKPVPNLKMGLERFLQNFPQQSGITALLRLKHKADVKTMPDWEAAIKELLKKKVQ